MAKTQQKRQNIKTLNLFMQCTEAKTFLLILEIKLIETEKYVRFEDARKIGEKSRNLSRPGRQ